jgi:hypothetical protein
MAAEDAGAGGSAHQLVDGGGGGPLAQEGARGWPRRLAPTAAGAVSRCPPRATPAGPQGAKALADQAERVLDTDVWILDHLPVGQAQ